MIIIVGLREENNMLERYYDWDDAVKLWVAVLLISFATFSASYTFASIFLANFVVML